MHSDVPSAGKIKSSNEVLNKIWEATNSSYLANLFGYPTDCPQRENGWTGDAQINVETGLYNFDGITIYEKWLADHQDEQQIDGGISNIVPNPGAFDMNLQLAQIGQVRLPLFLGKYMSFMEIAVC